MAPEIVIQKFVYDYGLYTEKVHGYNCLCDVWSVGCIAYSLICDGYYPFFPEKLIEVNDVRGKNEMIYHEHQKYIFETLVFMAYCYLRELYKEDEKLLE